tara:strand:+ start:20390 stop:22240 length:1851 start_codon:yes stop_codon:yes gene_type:complete
LKETKSVAYSYLIKQLPSATVYLNTNFEVVHASDNWIKTFDLCKTNVFGKRLHKLVKHANKKWLQSLDNCLLGQRQEGLASFIDNQGNEKWLEYTHLPWYDEGENIVGVIMQVDDVSESYGDQMEIERLQTLLQSQSEIAKVGSWEYDLVTEKLTWCQMTKAIHEVPKDYDPSIEAGIQFYKQGHSRNTIAMLVHKALVEGVAFREKLQIITAGGREKWVLAAGKPFLKNGKVTRLIGTFQDIDEQVKSEIKTKESEKLLNTLVDNLPLNVYVKDKESRKILVNKAECDYLGVHDKEELIGKSDFDLYDKNIAEISRNEDIEVMRTLVPIIGKETVSIKKDETATTFLTSKIPLLDINGNATGIIGLSMDISHLKEKENELRNLINVTAVQNKKLINFAHIVSHNLRSHTANFSMLLNFLVQEKDEAEKQRIVDMLTNASDNLMQTLEDLNEVVSISTNVNVERKRLNVNQQLAKIEQNLSALLKEHGVEIVNEIHDSTVIWSVPAYFDSILLNLITNAVKYRHPKRKPVIRFSVSKRKDYTIFSIEDNGLGIDMAKNGEKLFGMYKTFHDNNDSRGIGLYITKNQVEAMGGDIRATSELNKGTTFNVFFKNEDSK